MRCGGGSRDNVRMPVLKTLRVQKSCRALFGRFGLTLLLAAPAVVARAQAIDCASTPMPAERHICAHPELLDTLRDIEQRQADVLATADAAERIALEQAHERWRAGRNRCGQTPQSMDDCVRGHLQGRLATLPAPASGQSVP